jgi:hypothetical protein
MQAPNMPRRLPPGCIEDIDRHGNIRIYYMLHAWATNVDDPTVQPRWGKVGKQKIEEISSASRTSKGRNSTLSDEATDCIAAN